MSWVLDFHVEEHLSQTSVKIPAFDKEIIALLLKKDRIRWSEEQHLPPESK